MDLIESIKKNKAYVKCKQIVKNWENDFKTKNSRTPSKFDIKEAPSSIKYAYKKYFQLKSAVLENSLSICDFDEKPILSPELIQIEKFTNSITPEEPLMPILPSGKELERLLSTPNTNIIQNQIHDNLSKKLFQNRKFSLRNPRKSTNSKGQAQLSENSRGTTVLSDNVNINFTMCDKIEEKNIDDDSIVPNSIIIENGYNNLDCTGLIEEVNKTDGTFITFNNPQILKSHTIRQINENWLNRAEGVPRENLNTNKPETFGLPNLVNNLIDNQCDYVENSDSDDDNLALSKLKPALKKQKLNSPAKITETANRHIECIKKLQKENTDKVYKRKTKNTKNTTSNSKTLSDVTEKPPDIVEYLPFGLKEKVNPRHNNITDILRTIKTPESRNDIHTQNNTGERNKLEKKIESGTLNENFVRINIEKKVYSRGKKHLNYSKYKKQLWKDKKALHAGMEFPEAGKITCFKCSSAGHMARYCTAHKENSLLPLEVCDESNLPTLEDMQNVISLSKDKGKDTPVEDQLCTFLYQATKIPDEFLKLLAETPEDSNNIKPIYKENQENCEELYEILQKFGHSSFRPGQEHAIKRILCGLSTLLILSTGGGKSLCYQLPAYIYSKYYKCITLVISPLVSLMEDQVLSMPEFLKAGCIHTNQQPTQRRKVMELVKAGEINILLISPEALIASDTSSGFAGLFKFLPNIAFACIDEAHCVSQWSHNFRPSYLMICRVLREKLNVKCILGLTATASQTTIKSVIDHINISDGQNGVVKNPELPNNLYLSISYEKDKDRALVSLLTSDKIYSFTSIIVYCIRRNECERVASVIRSCLSQPGKINIEKQNKKRKRMSYIAEAYHAGMSAAQRKKIQKHFMDGTLKVIVATVAFGMGINKSDIRCIIHYNMPPSFESYVQEIGRAGRDGQPAFCHVFMNNSNTDKDELLKHIYANSIDRPVIRKLLQKVFIPCKCISEKILTQRNLIRCPGHEVGLPIETTVEELDLPSENIATLLCYVELHHKHYIKVLNNAYTTCKISSYGGPSTILEAAKTCAPLAMAYLLEGKKDSSVRMSSTLEFNVIEVAAAIGWESGMTKYHLKNLEWNKKDGLSKRSHLKVEFNNLGFRIKAPGDLSASELDSVLDELHEIVYNQERVMLHQLEEINKTFSKVRNYSCEEIIFTEESLELKSNELKSIISAYFSRENNLPENIVLQERPLDIARVTSDARALLATYKDCKFTGKSIARIFQGISSPNYPALVWGRCKFWRTHLHEDFDGIVKIATQQIIQMKI